MTFEQAVHACGIVAILRGVKPSEVLDIGNALFDAGIRVVEVPLNSPDPYVSITALSVHFKDRLVVGAGTVLDAVSVEMVKGAGGRISVSPDCNPLVISHAMEMGLVPLPGVFTPTEAFVAIRAGANHLKLFPAEAASPVTVKSWKAVLPKHVNIYAVGGVTPANMRSWYDAGCAGFGIGSNIYKPGMTADDVGVAARSFVAAWRECKGE